MRHAFKHLAQFPVPRRRSVKIRSCYCCQQKNTNSLPYLQRTLSSVLAYLSNFSIRSSLPSIHHLLTNITSVGSSNKLRSFPDPTCSLLLLPSSFIISWGLPGAPFNLQLKCHSLRTTSAHYHTSSFTFFTAFKISCYVIHLSTCYCERGQAHEWQEQLEA